MREVGGRLGSVLGVCLKKNPNLLFPEISPFPSVLAGKSIFSRKAALPHG